MLKRKSEISERWNKQIKISSPDANVSGCVYVSVITGKIKSIELLEGDNVRTDAQVIQYVNIQQNKDRHVDGTGVTHVDRLGQKLRLKVKFDIAGRFAFKVRLTPDGSNVSYSAGEKARNSNFGYSEGDIEFTTDVNGEKIIEADKVFVSPAGGDIFAISAIDTLGNEVTASAKVKTQRLLYYVEIKMRDLTTISGDMNVLVNEYAKHGIQFKAEASLEIPRRYTIKDDEEKNAFIDDIMEAYSASATTQKSPYCVGIVYTDQLPVMKPDVTFIYNNVMGGGSVNILLFDQQAKRSHCLWNNIVPTEDWYVDCHFIKDGDTDVNKVSISRDMCTIGTSSNTKPAGFYDMIRVDLSAVPKEKGKVVLKVNCVGLMKGGEALEAGLPIGLVCTRAWWRTMLPFLQNNIAIHEVGHKMGMVSDGGGKLPDKPLYYYENSGHFGKHCHKGLRAGLSDYRSLSQNARCVMYGGVFPQIAFCDECAATIKKLDIVDGLR